ncbi:hypothetical protein CPB85DRAFT_1354189 [Mucidula mucida]|nr:hypothetical protein CPB85DRAFT_1354189 [Mucidula mucida]
MAAKPCWRSQNVFYSLPILPYLSDVHTDMQTGSEALERQLALAIKLSRELQDTLRNALLRTSKLTKRELLQIARNALQNSEQLYATLVALEEIPTMTPSSPVRRSTAHALTKDHDALYPDEEDDIGNIAFYPGLESGSGSGSDGALSDGAVPDGLQLDFTLARAPEKMAEVTGRMTADIPSLRARIVRNEDNRTVFTKSRIWRWWAE